MSPFAWIAALVLAVTIGVALGLFGGGGSILTVPILVYVLRMDAHVAIATSLLVVGATSAAALIPHARAGQVDWRTGVVFGATSMVGAYAAGRLAHLVPGGVLLLGFGGMMLATSVAMLRPRRGGDADGAGAAPRRLPVPLVVAEGIVVGAVTGLVGAGGGFLVVPALVLIGRLPMARAIATSLLVIAMKSFAALAGHLGEVTIDLPIAAAITAAAVVGSALGAGLAHRIAGDTLRKAFAIFILLMALLVLGREVPQLLGRPLELARDWPWAVGAVIAVVGAALAATFVRRDRDGAGRPAPPPHTTRPRLEAP